MLWRVKGGAVNYYTGTTGISLGGAGQTVPTGQPPPCQQNPTLQHATPHWRKVRHQGSADFLSTFTPQEPLPDPWALDLCRVWGRDQQQGGECGQRLAYPSTYDNGFFQKSKQDPRHSKRTINVSLEGRGFGTHTGTHARNTQTSRVLKVLRDYELNSSGSHACAVLTEVIELQEASVSSLVISGRPQCLPHRLWELNKTDNCITGSDTQWTFIQCQQSRWWWWKEWLPKLTCYQLLSLGILNSLLVSH